MSCSNNRNDKLFINKKNDLWRVIQDGASKNDSSLLFFKVKKDGTYEELLSKKGIYVISKLNSDIKNYRQWNFTDDTTILFSHIPYRVKILNENVFLGVNQKNPSDTIKLIRYSR
jgi:hypothetical protein